MPQIRNYSRQLEEMIELYIKFVDALLPFQTNESSFQHVTNKNGINRQKPKSLFPHYFQYDRSVNYLSLAPPYSNLKSEFDQFIFHNEWHTKRKLSIIVIHILNTLKIEIVMLRFRKKPNPIHINEHTLVKVSDVCRLLFV